MGIVMRMVLLGAACYFLPVAQESGVNGLFYLIGTVGLSYFLGMGAGVQIANEVRELETSSE